MATVAELIANIDAQLELLIATPEVDYTEGDLTVKNSQKMDQLLKARKDLLKSLEASTDPDFDIITFDTRINEFGENKTERL
jgi:hypothetical protein